MCLFSFVLWSVPSDDVGRVHPNEDVVVFLSHSGQTEECISPAEHLRDTGTTCLCIVSQPSKTVTIIPCMYITSTVAHIYIKDPVCWVIYPFNRDSSCLCWVYKDILACSQPHKIICGDTVYVVIHSVVIINDVMVKAQWRRRVVWIVWLHLAAK